MVSSDAGSYMEITQRALLQLGISHGIQLLHEDDTFTASIFLPRHEKFDGESKCCRDCAVHSVSKKVYNYLAGHHLLPMGTPMPLENIVCYAATENFGEEVSKF